MMQRIQTDLANPNGQRPSDWHMNHNHALYREMSRNTKLIG